MQVRVQDDESILRHYRATNADGNDDYKRTQELVSEPVAALEAEQRCSQVQRLRDSQKIQGNQ